MRSIELSIEFFSLQYGPYLRSIEFSENITQIANTIKSIHK